METIGSILDKLSILELRKKNGGSHETKYSEYNRQIAYLFIEMYRVFREHLENNRPLVFKKNKLYDSHIKEESIDNIFDLINNLYKFNSRLWELEDIRRDRGLNDHQRLEAADEISTFNKRRNDTVDLIDEFIVNNLKLL